MKINQMAGRTVAICAISLCCASIGGCTGETEAISSTENAALTENAEDKGKEFGRIEDDTYINDYFGVAIDRMDDWAYAGEEKLAEINGYADEQDTQAISENSVESGKSIVVFYATDIYRETISLSISSIESVVNIDQSCLMSDEEFVQKVCDKMTDSDAESIFNIIGIDEGSGSVSIGTVYLFGQDTPCIRIHGTINGEDFYQSEVVIRCGYYYATLSATDYNDDYTDEVLGAFYSTEKGGALTHRDFDLLIGNEPVNIMDYCVPGYPDLYYYQEGIDESVQGVMRTARGIHLGDSLEQVIEAYGEAELYDFKEHQDDFSNLGYEFDAVTKFACYDYQGDEGKYDITFFYNGSDEVDAVVYECKSY